MMNDAHDDNNEAAATQAAAQQSTGAEVEDEQNTASHTDQPQNQESEAKQGQGRPEANPMRSVGDATKHWKQNLDVKDPGSEDTKAEEIEKPEPNKEEGGAAQQYE